VRGGRGLASLPKGEGDSLCMRQGAAADVGDVAAANLRPNVSICSDNSAHGDEGPWCTLGLPLLPLNKRKGSARYVLASPCRKLDAQMPQVGGRCRRRRPRRESFQQSFVLLPPYRNNGSATPSSNIYTSSLPLPASLVVRRPPPSLRHCLPLPSKTLND
jgi:hypothetical protein